MDITNWQKKNCKIYFCVKMTLKIIFELKILHVKKCDDSFLKFEQVEKEYAKLKSNWVGLGCYVMITASQT